MPRVKVGPAPPDIKSLDIEIARLREFRHEVCGAFRRAADARSEVEFLHQILVWVMKMIEGRSEVAKP
jgi:hypothetical protein